MVAPIVSADVAVEYTNAALAYIVALQVLRGAQAALDIATANLEAAKSQLTAAVETAGLSDFTTTS